MSDLMYDEWLQSLSDDLDMSGYILSFDDVFNPAQENDKNIFWTSLNPELEESHETLYATSHRLYEIAREAKLRVMPIQYDMVCARVPCNRLCVLAEDAECAVCKQCITAAQEAVLFGENLTHTKCYVLSFFIIVD